MKGNEARVVFFLHPVDQLKDGQVSKVQPLRRSFAVTVLLLLGLLLGLGVLVFVLLQFGVKTRNQQELVSTPAPFDTSNHTRGNDSSMETELSTATSCMTDGVSMPNKLCIFPFKFNGALHKECTWTSAHLTGNKPWCSTFVNETGHHVRGHGNWGNCGPGCPIPPDHRQPPPLPVQKGMVTELPTEIIQPGITYDTILCHKFK